MRRVFGSLSQLTWGGRTCHSHYPGNAATLLCSPVSHPATRGTLRGVGSAHALSDSFGRLMHVTLGDWPFLRFLILPSGRLGFGLELGRGYSSLASLAHACKGRRAS